MRARAALGFVWVGLVALLVLAARSMAYGLAEPADLSSRLEHSAGGPGLVVLGAASLGLAASLSGAVVWLAALGVRERHRLWPERPAPRLLLRRLTLRAIGLYAASSFAFALLESYLHWRAGIGFHGLSCLLGPVHRDAIPLLGALALFAASLAEAGQHLFAWMRAAVSELIRPDVPVMSPPAFARLAHDSPAGAGLFRRAEPRAPPLPA